MAEIHKTTIIETPVEELFTIIDNAENFPRYVPNVSAVADVKRSDQRMGDSFRVTYKVLGVTFDEKFTTTDYQRPHRLAATFEGGMSGTFRWTLEPLGPKTKLSVEIEYGMPGGALGKAVDSLLLERVNEKSIDGMLENLGRLAAKGGIS
jgi:ribosome-associated toxin RatA of RatAB toxin-antitoxin module